VYRQVTSSADRIGSWPIKSSKQAPVREKREGEEGVMTPHGLALVENTRWT
jgi:hypothetical protein